MAKSTSKLFESETPNEMMEDAINLPEVSDEESKKELVSSDTTTSLFERNDTSNDDDIQDVEISAIKKKRFRINGDKTRILELNTSDLSITSRMTSAYDRLIKHMDEVGKVLATLPDNETELTEDKEAIIAEQLKAIDEEMRKEIDYIFDAPVSEVCGYGGSMYDPFEGMFRFEHIIDAISKLYETNLNNEFNKMRRRVNSKTSKYTKKYHN